MSHRERPERLAPGVFVCGRCPEALSTSCCEVKPHERLATITRVDADRVSAATGLSMAAFTDWEWIDADHLKAWLDVHPAYARYLGPSPRRLSLKAVDGRCALWRKGRGCLLPVEARPIPCRIYPFDVGEGQLQVERWGDLAAARHEVVAGRAHACLAVEEADGPRALYRAFGTTPAKVRALAAQLRLEIAEHARRERAEALETPRRAARRSR